MSLLSEIPTLETLKINCLTLVLLLLQKKLCTICHLEVIKQKQKLFTKWVTKALKQIRIHGYYIATEKDQEWLDIRTEGKKVRKDFTDEIQEFVY